MNQIIDVHTLFDKTCVSNICLHLQHLSDLHPPPDRLGMVSWRGCYPTVLCELYDASVRIYRGRRSFLFVPDFPDSLISHETAVHFGLAVSSGVFFYSPIPLAQYAGLAADPIAARLMAKAQIDFAGTGSVEPKPAASEEFLFWVSDRVSPDFAILGRNVMDKLLLLYRGYSYDGLPGGAPQKPSGHVYFGADSREKV